MHGGKVLRWVRRALLGLVASIVVLTFAGVVYQAVDVGIDGREYPAPGRMVDVGGYRMHLDVMGEGRGGPTVILDAGAQSASFQWGWVQPEVAEGARVVAYDRPGQGWSEEPLERLDAGERAEDLHEALDRAGIEGPYVVVGHSMGSLSARAFAERYPDEVVGAVLVDPRNLSLHEDFPEDFPEASVPSEPPFAVGSSPSRPGSGSSGFWTRSGTTPSSCRPVRRARGGRTSLPRGPTTGRTWPDVLAAESAASMLRDGEHLRGKPVVVLSAGEPDAMNFPPGDRRAFTAMHARMAEDLSSRGEHKTVEGADHLSVVTDRENAKKVADAVRRVVEEAGAR